MAEQVRLRGRKIVLGVGGGIAAYKAVELVRLLTTAGAEVQVVMTEAATRFVGELTFQALSGRSVFTNLSSAVQDAEIGHIRIADGADLMILAPATANMMAALAAGTAANAVTAVVLASRSPILVAPSMNTNMWTNQATQRSLATLTSRANYHIVGPESGVLACRWTGPGRLAEPADIAEMATRILSPSDLLGRRVVVSAGPTREPIDPVRFLSNPSTGRMGVAIARAAWRRGAEVHLIVGPTELALPLGVEVERIETAAQMYDAVMAAAETADVVIKAAAVADMRPKTAFAEKWKKRGRPWEVAWEPTKDILADLGRLPERRFYLVGFAAETARITANAVAKLQDKRCDLIVANDTSQPGIGFASERNQITLVDANGATPVAEASKQVIADAILDRVVNGLRR